jgi:polyisoprenoid-binding protein YceI
MMLGRLLLPLVAVAGALARWLFQARGNLYTDASTSYYVPDRDLTWRAVDHGPVALGLDAIGLLAGYAVALAVAILILRRWERRRGASVRGGRAAVWVLAALPLLVPAWAFASGSIPDDAVESRPAGLVVAPSGTITGGLPGLPAGTYRVVPHTGTSITAHVSAGGEAFEARFARDVEGTWRGAPADLRQPMRAELSVAATAVDTGIELRTKHAREEYLDMAHFPRIRFALDRVLGARGQPGGSVAYSAQGTVELMGRRHPVAVAGTLRAPDAAGRRRLGFAADEAIFLASAHLEIKIHESKLAPDAGDFDGDVIPIDVQLVLRRAAGAP